jgi:hypothetical protein
MQFALQDSKRLLHYRAAYRLGMDTPNARLKAARSRKYAKAVDAADALGIPRGTYLGHENGHRGFPAARAPTYARRFGVSEEWLLYGKGDDTEPMPSAELIEQMIRETIDAEVRLETKLADLPRIFGKALHEQLEHWRADQTRTPMAEATAPDKGTRSRAPTTPDAPGGSRTP